MKEDSLAVYYHSDLTEISDFEALSNWESISKDWYQNTLITPAYYALELDNTRLCFRVKCAFPAVYDESYLTGDFKEGLWKMDVAELFIKDDNSETYQEFNLSPAGAWWSSKFSSYRQECAKGFQVPKSVSVKTNRSATHWYASLTILRSELAVNCSFSKLSRANVCFIFGQEPSRTYLSVGAPDHGEPDYHRTEIFPTIFSKKET